MSETITQTKSDGMLRGFTISYQWPVLYLTPAQFGIKADMGLMKNAIVERRFNWRFWCPVQCIGGLVRFGTYYAVVLNESEAK